MDDDNRAEELARRSEELIARANATLSAPRPTGEMWQRPQPDQRQRPQQPEPKRPIAKSADPAQTQLWQGWFLRRLDAAIRAYADASEAAVARFVTERIAAQRSATDFRLGEIERRLAALETTEGINALGTEGQKALGRDAEGQKARGVDAEHAEGINALGVDAERLRVVR